MLSVPSLNKIIVFALFTHGELRLFMNASKVLHDFAKLTHN